MFQKHSIHRCFVASAFLSSSVTSSKSTVWTSRLFHSLTRRQPQCNHPRSSLSSSWGVKRNILSQPRGGTSTTSSSSLMDASSSATASTKSKKETEVDIEQVAQETKTSILGGVVCRKFANSVPYFDSSIHADEFRVVFILGGPGAGKGTQSNLLAQNYPCVHLSAGELLREAAAENSTSPHQQLIADCLVSGKIVPVEISLALLQAAMQQASLTRGKSLIFLIDGFPRNFDNLHGWSQCMSLPQIASVWGVLYYTCPLRELERRILERASQGSGRSDDNLQSAQKRFKTFEQQTVPVVKTLQRVQELQQQACRSSKSTKNTAGNDETLLTLQVATLAGDQSLENVWKDTQKVMNGWIAHDVWSANARLLEAIQERNVTVYQELAVYCDENDKMDAMNRYEPADVSTTIANPHMEFETGTKVIVSYDRTLRTQAADGEQQQQPQSVVSFRERRVWAHQGTNGWVNVHFYRTPVVNV